MLAVCRVVAGDGCKKEFVLCWPVDMDEATHDILGADVRANLHPVACSGGVDQQRTHNDAPVKAIMKRQWGVTECCKVPLQIAAYVVWCRDLARVWLVNTANASCTPLKLVRVCGALLVARCAQEHTLTCPKPLMRDERQCQLNPCPDSKMVATSRSLYGRAPCTDMISLLRAQHTVTLSKQLLRLWRET